MYANKVVEFATRSKLASEALEEGATFAECSPLAARLWNETPLGQLIPKRAVQPFKSLLEDTPVIISADGALTQKLPAGAEMPFRIGNAGGFNITSATHNQDKNLWTVGNERGIKQIWNRGESNPLFFQGNVTWVRPTQVTFDDTGRLLSIQYPKPVRGATVPYFGKTGTFMTRDQVYKSIPANLEY